MKTREPCPLCGSPWAHSAGLECDEDAPYVPIDLKALFGLTLALTCLWALSGSCG